MKETKTYKLRIRIVCVLVLQAVVMASCSPQNKPSEDHLLTMIINWDSVSVYQGELRKNSVIEMVAVEETAFKNFIAKKKQEIGKELSLHVKLSLRDAGAGVMDRIGSLIRWADQSGIGEIELVDMTEKEQNILKLPGIPWAYLDSLRAPSSLKLNMPKEEGFDISHIDQTSPSVITAKVANPEIWYCYFGVDSLTGKTFSRKEFSALLGVKKKEWRDQVVVLVKLYEGSDPDVIIAALEEKSKSGIENFEIIFPPVVDRPIRKLTVEDFLYMPPEPVEIITPGTVTTEGLPTDNAFVIEIRADQSVWYQPLSPTSKMAPQKVKEPITQNLKQIIGDYQSASAGNTIQYFIKGNKNAKYPVFEKVVNALKETNIFKYNLVTAE